MVFLMNPKCSKFFSLADKIFGAIASSLSEKSLNVFLNSSNICLIITSVHLSPTTSKAVVTGQSHLKILPKNDLIFNKIYFLLSK